MRNYSNQTSKLKSLVKLGIIFSTLFFVTSSLAFVRDSAHNSIPRNSLNRIKANSNFKPKDDFYLLRMGSGYDQVTMTATSGQTCLANASKPENLYIGNPSAEVTFDHSQKIDKIEKSLNVDVSGRYGGDRFGVSMAAQFANEAKSNNYTTNILYLYKYAGKAMFVDGSLGQGLDALTPFAASIEEKSPTAFRSMCGNSFIEQMDAGVVLAINVSLSFNSHSDQQRLAAKMSGDVGLGGIAAEIKQAASGANVHVDLSLSAIQQGGEPQRLNDLFGKPDAGGNYPIINCETSPTGSDACGLMFSNIIAYAQTLPQQLAGSSGGLDAKKLYYSNPTITDYKNLGIPTIGAPDPSSEILQAMQQLTIQYDKVVDDYNFLNHYLTSLADKLDAPTKENLRDAAQLLGKQISNVFLLPAYRINDCYKGYVSTECLSIRDNVESALQDYQLRDNEPALLNYLETTSYQGYLTSYYGGADARPEDYHQSQYLCTFAPVSDPETRNFAIYCDGRWLNTEQSKGVHIKPGFEGEGLYMDNLVYLSISPDNQHGQMIRYKDLVMFKDGFYDNYYLVHGVGVTSANYENNETDLGLTQLHENQA